MSKFIVHKDALLYTTHGFLSAEHLYNVYKKEGLKKNCCLVGWKPNGEIYGSIYSISEFDSDMGVVTYFKEYGREDLAVVTNMDYGHTVPQLILPYGAECEINPTQKTVSILESGVSA